MYGHYLFARAYDDLLQVIDGDEIGFMWWASLEHFDVIPISWGVCIIFRLHECSCHLFPKCRILFSSGFEWLIVRWGLEYCLWWSSYELHILTEVFNFFSYKARLWCQQWCCCRDFIWFDEYDLFVLDPPFLFPSLFILIEFLYLLNILPHIFVVFSFISI